MRIQSLLTGPARPLQSMPLQTRYRARFALALGLSLLVHALVLSLRFGAPGAGLPGLALPWSERRVQAPGLTVRLVEVPRPTPSAPPPNDPLRLKLSTELTIPPKPTRTAQLDRPFDAALASAEPVSPSTGAGRDGGGAAGAARPDRDALTPAPAASAGGRDPKTAAQPLPPILTQRDPQHETFNVPPPSRAQPDAQRAPETVAQTPSEEVASVPEPREAASRQAEEARLKTEEATRQRAEEEARQRALAREKELEARTVAEERAREAEELAQKRALALQKEEEAKRLEEARRIEEARKLDEARRQAELKNQEEEKRAALELEARKRAEELARQQAVARQKELEAKRQADEAAARAREVAERQRMDAEAAAQRQRELAARQPTGPGPRPLSGTELAAKALEQFRTAPGAVMADPTRPPSPPPPPVTQRRRSIFGIEREVSLRMYVDSWRWKIERAGTVNYRPSAAWRARENPIVTVSIRSDGSLEDVLINRSSGVREIDEAVLRIAQLHAPYSKFPPDIARHYDVIEIRRVWMFDARLRILDEM